MLPVQQCAGHGKGSRFGGCVRLQNLAGCTRHFPEVLWGGPHSIQAVDCGESTLESQGAALLLEG